MRCLLLVVLLFLGVSAYAQTLPPTLDDFWEGRAVFVVDIANVGLPMGESDTVDMGDGVLWSYLHASHRSAGIIDQCGQPVAFPGCLTLWESRDNGRSFSLSAPVCLLPCRDCPCNDQRDHIAAQQYPRVARAEDGTFYMAYEWHAQTMLRRSEDGVNWSDWSYLRVPSGTFPSSFHPCSEVERIGKHPFIRGQADDCLVGAPPGIYVEGDMLYVFVEAGSAPAHMRCYKGNRHEPLDRLRLCDTDPLFGGAREYGDETLMGRIVNAYFDFRNVSSADVLKVGERYYLFYEGVRGPDELERGLDTQFALGLARSVTNRIDGAWERYPHNPILMDMSINWGVGHADVLVQDGVTYVYTATAMTRRGRYKLVWRDDAE